MCGGGWGCVSVSEGVAPQRWSKVDLLVCGVKQEDQKSVTIATTPQPRTDAE